MRDWTLVGCVLSIIAILGLGICQQVYLERVTYDMINSVEVAEKLAKSGNIQESIIKLQDNMAKWEKDKKMLETIANHEDIHKISNSLVEIDGKLKSFYEQDNVSSNFALLKEYIRGIKEGNEFTINNIL